MSAQFESCRVDIILFSNRRLLNAEELWRNEHLESRQILL